LVLQILVGARTHLLDRNETSYEIDFLKGKGSLLISE
jgi:hypothetical protein